MLTSLCQPPCDRHVARICAGLAGHRQASRQRQSAPAAQLSSSIAARSTCGTDPSTFADAHRDRSRRRSAPTHSRFAPARQAGRDLPALPWLQPGQSPGGVAAFLPNLAAMQRRLSPRLCHSSLSQTPVKKPGLPAGHGCQRSTIANWTPCHGRILASFREGSGSHAATASVLWSTLKKMSRILTSFFCPPL